MTRIVLTFILLIGSKMYAQDLNCHVNVIAPSIQLTNKQQLINSLQNAVSQFMNNRKWSDDRIMSNERVQCNIQIEIKEVISLDEFSAAIQVISIRPVYGSSYTSTILNHYDDDWVFKFQEFQALEFQENMNLSNLTSVLAYYAYIILGMDYDSFSPEGGTPYYNKAQGVLNACQNVAGWRAQDGKNNRNRYYLIENLTSDRFRSVRQTLFSYHFKGLDIMHKDPEKGRQEITESLKNLEEICRLVPNAALIKVFFFSKNKEIVEIYKEATPAEKNKIFELLSKLDPANKSIYEKIKT